MLADFLRLGRVLTRIGCLNLLAELLLELLPVSGQLKFPTRKHSHGRRDLVFSGNSVRIFAGHRRLVGGISTLSRSHDRALKVAMENRQPKGTVIINPIMVLNTRLGDFGKFVGLRTWKYRLVR